MRRNSDSIIMIICSCYGVTDEGFREAVRSARAGKPMQCPAGRGCGSCQPTLLAMLERERTETTAEAGDPSSTNRAVTETLQV